ncbi:Rieske (2Fe-2S) protein [Thermopolyspora sp. NPDC052614]|uniref:Rieske (2Fe-2S) protein n=1 Tax=Thermopolyspora sp. NPDC052614 TaxID=3155682 RepID=UPI0034182C85
MSESTRRAVFSRAAFAGVAAVVAQAIAWVRPAAAAESTGETTESAAGPVIAKTKDIPVGGGKIIRGKYVVTRPKKNVFRAFSATCTHQGCTVASVRGGTINCPCHGSKFKITNGAVAAGPAKRPLPRRKIKVSNGRIRLV